MKMVGNWINKVLILCIVCMLVGCKEMEKKVVCIGDSITYGYLLPKEESYPYKLKEMLPESYQVYNSSQVGLSANEYRKSDLFQEAVSMDPDIVIVMFGSNDSNSMEYESMDSFRKNYIHLIDSFQKSKVILCTPCTPYSENYGVNAKNLSEIVEEIKRIGKEKNLSVVDIYAITQNHPEWFEVDGIHPSRKGTDAIAQAIYEVIS